MQLYKIQILETIIVILGYFVVHFSTKVIVNNLLKRSQLQRGRRKLTLKLIQLFSFLSVTILLAAIWGLKQNQIAVFVGTIVTALGIAFFAQWSLLSNITSGLLLFFNHPIKIGDYLKILDKDIICEGQVHDLNFFFLHLKTNDGKIITIPNSLLFQKSISIISEQKED